MAGPAQTLPGSAMGASLWGPCTKYGLVAALVYIGLLIPLALIKALEKYLESPGRPF